MESICASVSYVIYHIDYQENELDYVKYHKEARSYILSDSLVQTTEIVLVFKVSTCNQVYQVGYAHQKHTPNISLRF